MSPTDTRSRASLQPPQVVALLFLAAALSGCGYIQEMKLPFITPSGQKLTDSAASAEIEMQSYPQQAPLGPSLDIEVIREGNAIIFDNRSVAAYAGVQVWLNHEFGAEISELPIGRSKPIALESFINHYGEVYPVGWFLRPERDRPLIMADLVDQGKLHKLTVRLQGRWRESQ